MRTLPPQRTKTKRELKKKPARYVKYLKTSHVNEHSFKRFLTYIKNVDFKS